MRTLFLFIFLCVASNAYAKNIVLTIPDDDIKIVENDVFDAEQWIRDAWNGKLSKCKSRIVKSEIDRLVKENKAVPSGGEDAIAKSYIDGPLYKSRKDKDLNK